MMYDKLDYVLAIADEQNLTKAAQKLYISQPTLTMYLNRLEEQLGVRLFNRKKSPILLTDAGKYYIKKMKEISDAEQLLRNELRGIAAPMETLSIGIGRVRGHYWLPPILKSLADIYPSINFSIMQGAEQDIMDTIGRGRLDVGIGVFPRIEDNMEQIELTAEKTLLVSHRKFRLVPGNHREENSPYNPYQLPPKRLNQLPFILPHVANGMYNSTQRLMDTYQIKPSRIISIGDLSIGLCLVGQGLGVQLTPASFVASAFGGDGFGSLEICALESFQESRVCSAVYLQSSGKLNLIQDTIRILREDVLPSLPFHEIIEH